MKVIDSFYNKIFHGTLTTISREELENMPCPFYTAEVSDETMQKIIDEVDAEMEVTYGSDFDFENDRHNEYWWEVLERECRWNDVPYYEDLD